VDGYTLLSSVTDFQGDDMEIEPIGVVKSAVKDAQTVDGWGKVVSEIHIDESYARGLQSIDDWSHVVVIFYMHEVTFDSDRHLVRRPRNRDDMPEVGVFAQRSRSHPNPIGISAVKILEVSEHILTVQGLDAIDGTPVLDIKPYAPVYDGVYDPRVPVWFIRLMQGYF
jgi:tRNA-Thr(GGU) m(6)t(6)A37 methyltransferase TsaA